MKKRYLALLSLLLLCTGMIWLLARDAPLELSKEEYPFNGIQMPPRSVSGDIFMDGGSVWVRVVDQAGNTIDLAFPYDDSGGKTEYTSAFYGAMLSSKSGATALKDPKRAKSIALVLLRRYGNFSEGGTKQAYYSLSERDFWNPINFFQYIIHRIKNSS